MVVLSLHNNRIGVMPETIEPAEIKRLRWEKPEWPAAFLSLALTQLEARWESLVSDIGMAGPPLGATKTVSDQKELDG